jgi:hypothetical protein
MQSITYKEKVFLVMKQCLKEIIKLFFIILGYFTQSYFRLFYFKLFWAIIGCYIRIFLSFPTCHLLLQVSFATILLANANKILANDTCSNK